MAQCFAALLTFLLITDMSFARDYRARKKNAELYRRDEYRQKPADCG